MILIIKWALTIRRRARAGWTSRWWSWASGGRARPRWLCATSRGSSTKATPWPWAWSSTPRTWATGRNTTVCSSGTPYPHMYTGRPVKFQVAGQILLQPRQLHHPDLQQPGAEGQKSAGVPRLGPLARGRGSLCLRGAHQNWSLRDVAVFLGRGEQERSFLDEMAARGEIAGWMDVCAKDGSNVDLVGLPSCSFSAWLPKIWLANSRTASLFDRWLSRRSWKDRSAWRRTRCFRARGQKRARSGPAANDALFYYLGCAISSITLFGKI